MKITSVDVSLVTLGRAATASSPWNPTVVRINTDEGVSGYGEMGPTYGRAKNAAFGMARDFGRMILGMDPMNNEQIWDRLHRSTFWGMGGGGVIMGAVSAIDIALWDLYGQRHKIPVHEALGGAVRQEIQVYNTCSGYVFNGKSSAYNSGSSRRVIRGDEAMQGPYDDQVAFHQDAGKLAESLLAEGFRIMKIWPFDPFAEKTQGMWISDEDIQKGLKPFRQVREAVGNRMEIMCELHSLWSLPAAIRICQALEACDVFWAEDPLCKMDDIQQLGALRAATRTPVCGSETLSGAVTFRQMFSAGVFDYAMIDLGWCGGITEGRKIAALAESYNIPLAPHD